MLPGFQFRVAFYGFTASHGGRKVSQKCGVGVDDVGDGARGERSVSVAVVKMLVIIPLICL